ENSVPTVARQTICSTSSAHKSRSHRPTSTSTSCSSATRSAAFPGTIPFPSIHPPLTWRMPERKKGPARNAILPVGPAFRCCAPTKGESFGRGHQRRLPRGSRGGYGEPHRHLRLVNCNRDGPPLSTHS